MALQTSSSSLSFKVKRCKPELVTPANPTPLELKQLSDLDDQLDLRFHVPLIQFFRHKPSMAGKDPVQVIRQALAKTLVFYYPFAGRFKEGPDGKLIVNCTGEGVIFVEADADVTLDEFGKELRPPFPCFDELLYNFPGSDGNEIIDSPLMHIQVTRLKCGGFIFAFSYIHVMGDAIGISQFMKDLGEIARGAPKPSILPVWCRELLCARNPPRITCIHHEYQQLPHDNQSPSILHHRSFFFGPTEMAAIRRLLPRQLAKINSFEVLTAFVWRCRTIALQWENPNQEVRLLCLANARYGRCRLTPPLPDGFYGNAFITPTAVTTVEKLCRFPLDYALKLVRNAGNKASEEYVRSVVDLMAINGKRSYLSNGVESLEVTDITKAGLEDVNLGWGKNVYGGVPYILLTTFIFVGHTNFEGEQGRLLVICLPPEAMERFAKQIDNLLKIKNSNL